MYPSRYFPDRYFAPRYWPKTGADPAPVTEHVGSRYRYGFRYSWTGSVLLAVAFSLIA